MKRFKKIYILLGVLVLVCVAAFAVSRFEERKEQIKNSDAVILELPDNSVQSLSWEYEDSSLAFHRDEDGVWLYDEDEAFPVDGEKIAALLAPFQSFGVAFVIEEVEDYGQYGLDEPVCTIRLSTDESSYEVKLGDFSKMDSQRYVSIGDGNVYLVRNDPMDQYDAVLSDLIDHDEFPSFDQPTEITFSGAESYRILYQPDSGRSYCADDVYFAQLDGESLPLDTYRVEDYLGSISLLDPTDYVTYNATEEELHACGLDEPELTVAVDYTTGAEEGDELENRFVLHIGLDREEKEAAEQAAAEAEEKGEEPQKQSVTAYVRVGESPIVYRISSGDYEDLCAGAYDDLRHREVLTADLSQITQIDISLEGQSYTITSQVSEDEDGDEERVYSYGETELDLKALRSALKALSAGSFTDESPAQKEEIGLTIHLDNETHPQVQVSLYRYDGDKCLAAVNGETVALIARSQVVDLIEAVYGIVLN
ncbi:MAG: DUF4340 domain-containing protein [Oscillospiraceae bacterium]